MQTDGESNLWTGGITVTEGIFGGEVDKTYGFYTVAVDKAGNREVSPSGPDAVIKVTQGDNRIYLPLVIK